MSINEQDANANQQKRIPVERTKFRALLLTNPNYFGNVEASPFPPVLSLQLDSTYEKIGCVGFQPQFNRLDAVIHINEPGGYGGGVCSRGTQEYVRFYLSGDNGATWEDAGLSSFTAYDIPGGTVGARRLEYGVTLQVNPAKRLCFLDNIHLVRAILSWNVPPPPNAPNFVPVWGDIHTARIQVDPLKIIIFNDLLKQAQVKLPSVLEQVLDLTQPLALAEPKQLDAVQLHELYKGTNVEPHRFALAQLQQLISQPALTDDLMASGSTGILQQLGLEAGDLADVLFPQEGSTLYEELECIGLNPNQDALVGVIRVKLPNGYSGGLCTAGSREYVAFWGDFDGNGSFETYLGSTSVNVHDIIDTPRGGLSYSVFLPVSLDRYRRRCQRGAVVVRIRAILSWQVAPPASNPDYVPVWGNRQQALIHIRPGSVVSGHPPVIETVGSMSVLDINGAGYANGPAQLVGFTAKQSPFGGEVVITGHLANPTDISAGVAPLRYRVIVNDGTGDQLLNNPFNIARTQLLDGVWSFLPGLTQTVDSANYYTYREDLSAGPGNAQIFVAGNILARWETAGKRGTWTIRVEVLDADGFLHFGNTVTVRLDNSAPQIPAGSFRITSGGGSCGDFAVGDVIEGTYAVTDEHFGALSFAVLPPSGGVFTAPVPLPRTYPLVPTTGEAGVWRLDTTGMPTCGYVIRFGASDRTIVNSAYIGFYSEAFVGLCLKG